MRQAQTVFLICFFSKIPPGPGRTNKITILCGQTAIHQNVVRVLHSKRVVQLCAADGATVNGVGACVRLLASCTWLPTALV